MIEPQMGGFRPVSLCAMLLSSYANQILTKNENQLIVLTVVACIAPSLILIPRVAITVQNLGPPRGSNLLMLPVLRKGVLEGPWKGEQICGRRARISANPYPLFVS